MNTRSTLLTEQEAHALIELRRAVDRFFSFRAEGNQKHVKVSWEAWDTLFVARGNLPASLYIGESL